MLSKANTIELSLLELNQKIFPSEFKDILKSFGVENDIYYIQPDYELQLDSLSDTDTSDYTPEIYEVETEEPVVENTPEQYSVMTAANSVLVAIIDTGMDTGHSALAEYAVPGWNFPDGNDIVYDSAYPTEYAHGTHVSGIISTIAKQIGANIQIMPLKVFKDGKAYTSDIIAAIEYATEAGAQIINCSFGSTEQNQALQDAISASNALFVCAVGNSRRDMETVPSYPAGYKLPNVISVASTNADGGFSYFSNYGASVIDIAAQGRDIFSAFPNDEYGNMTGTSMAAANVTGVAAVVLSQENISSSQLRERLINTADTLINLTNKVMSGKRLNPENALGNIMPTNILDLNPADDFDIHGYQPTESEIFDLYSAAGDVIQISTRDEYTLVLKSNGTVWAWGDNQYGQCGNGNLSYAEQLVQVTGLNNIITIAAGYHHSAALKNDGTVWAWGNNRLGELGDGTTTTRTTPVQVMGLNNVTAISVSDYHSMALKNDGTVWAWGYNGNGQLGDGTTIQRITPVQAIILNNITAISAGFYQNMALKSDGTVWIWSASGPSPLQYPTPVQVIGLNGVIAINVNHYHSMALKNDGTVWTWGSNGNGALGNGTTIYSEMPVQVIGLKGVTAISAGHFYSMALKNDGTVWAWGDNCLGQLGDGTTINRTTPVQVTGLSDVKAIDAGYLYSLSLKNDGTVWAWGSSHYGQFGDGTTVWSRTPVKIENMNGVISIGTGYGHTLALKDDGTVWAWGRNDYGQLGDGTTINRTIPFQVEGLSGVKTIVASSCYSMALKNDGTIWVWGDNSYGQLGDGTTLNRTTPVQVVGLSDVKTIVASSYCSMALKNDGIVWAWGNNSSGNFGNGTTTSSKTPVQVTNISGVISIAARYKHTLALKSDGTVWAWGYNSYGQLGDGTTLNKTIPFQVEGLSNVKTIVVGSNHSLALKNDGTVWAWGCNSYGQLGDSTTTNSKTPIQITNFNNVIAIMANSNQSMALKNDGSVWTWGCNTPETFKDGITTSTITPLQMIGLSNVTDISMGSYFIAILKNDGTVWVWGRNDYGQLGLQYHQASNIPIIIQTQPDDHPNTQALAQTYTMVQNTTQTINGTVNNLYDRDWFAIKSMAIVDLNITLAAVDNNVKVNIYDSYLILISSARNYNFTSVSNEIYYICVSYTQGANYQPADYTLTIQSGDIIISKALCTMEIINQDEYRLNLSVNEMQNISNYTFKLTYSTAQIDILDLAAQTDTYDISTGPIPGTNIQILTFANGIITFKVIPRADFNNNWQGARTTILFKAKVTGITTLTFEQL